MTSRITQLMAALTFALAVSDAGAGHPELALSRPTCAPVAELLGWSS